MIPALTSSCELLGTLAMLSITVRTIFAVLALGLQGRAESGRAARMSKARPQTSGPPLVSKHRSSAIPHASQLPPPMLRHPTTCTRHPAAHMAANRGRRSVSRLRSAGASPALTSRSVSRPSAASFTLRLSATGAMRQAYGGSRGEVILEHYAAAKTLGTSGSHISARACYHSPQSMRAMDSSDQRIERTSIAAARRCDHRLQRLHIVARRVQLLLQRLRAMVKAGPELVQARARHTGDGQQGGMSCSCAGCTKRGQRRAEPHLRHGAECCRSLCWSAANAPEELQGRGQQEDSNGSRRRHSRRVEGGAQRRCASGCYGRRSVAHALGGDRGGGKAASSCSQSARRLSASGSPCWHVQLERSIRSVHSSSQGTCRRRLRRLVFAGCSLAGRCGFRRGRAIKIRQGQPPIAGWRPPVGSTRGSRHVATVVLVRRHHAFV